MLHTLKRVRRWALGYNRKLSIPAYLETAARTGLTIETGGPTAAFEETGFLPVYKYTDRYRLFNFSAFTQWSETACAQVGTRSVSVEISEACALPVETGEASVFLSSHVIEHLADPISGLLEARRILRRDGYLVLVVPHKDGAYDHRRAVTTLTHLESDYEARRGEADSTHFDEILRLHDLRRDVTTSDSSDLMRKVSSNTETRFCHHHVFDTSLVLQLLHRCNFKICLLELIRPYHIVAIASPDPEFQLEEAAAREIRKSLIKSPFPTDRRPVRTQSWD